MRMRQTYVNMPSKVAIDSLPTVSRLVDVLVMQNP